MSEKTVYRRPQYTDRPCITCRATFKSAGHHHRMCNSCKTYRLRADGEYARMEVETWPM